MASSIIEITYRLRPPGGKAGAEGTIRVRLDPTTLEAANAVNSPPPEWTRLEVEQCAVCPLKKDSTPYCPAALSFVELIEAFGEILSYTEVEATVMTRERTITQRTTLQRALSSLVGLRLATCGCPIVSKFKPMARFHLPFATTEETLFRSAGAYLIAQYFLRRRGGAADLELDGLRSIYAQIHEVNKGLTRRLRTIEKGDAHLNAIVILDLFAHVLPFSIEEKLAELEHMFEPFLAQLRERPAADQDAPG